MKKLFLLFTFLFLSHNIFSLTKIALVNNNQDISFAGLFENPDYQFIKCADSKEAAKALMEGYCDGAIFSLPASRELYFLSDKRILCAGVTGEADLYCVSNDKNCKSVTDLLGKRVCAPRGGIQEALIAYIFEKYEMPIERGRGGVTLEWENNYSLCLSKLIEGKYSYAILSEPGASASLKNSRLSISVDFKSELEAMEGRSVCFPKSLLMVRKDYLEENKDSEAFFLDMKKSAELINNNPVKAAALYEKNAAFQKRQLLSKSIKNGKYTFLNQEKDFKDVEFAFQIYDSYFKKNHKSADAKNYENNKISPDFFSKLRIF